MADVRFYLTITLYVLAMILPTQNDWKELQKLVRVDFQ